MVAPGLLLGVFQPQRHVDQAGRALGGKARAQQLAGQPGGHAAVDGRALAGAHAVAQQHLRAPGAVAELVAGVAAHALPRRGAAGQAEDRGEQRPLRKAQHGHGAAVGDVGQRKVAAAGFAHLLGQGGGFVGAEADARHRDVGGQPPGRIGRDRTLERVPAPAPQTAARPGPGGARPAGPPPPVWRPSAPGRRPSRCTARSGRCAAPRPARGSGGGCTTAGSRA